MAGLRLHVLEAIVEPQRILAGGSGELIAVRELEPGKWLVAVNRELRNDAFVFTDCVTRCIAQLDGRRQLWP